MEKSLDKEKNVCYTPYVKQIDFYNKRRSGQNASWQKTLKWAICSIFYGEVLTPKQREMLNQYYNDDLSLSEIGENFGITRQGARDAIKHGETTLKELEAKVGFAGRYRRVQEKLEELEQLVIDARFECTGPYARLTTTEYAATLNKMLGLIRSIDEVNES